MSQSGHDFLRQSEGGGVIPPKYQHLVDMSENKESIDEPQEDQGQNEEVYVISPK